MISFTHDFYILMRYPINLEDTNTLYFDDTQQVSICRVTNGPGGPRRYKGLGPLRTGQ